MIKKGPGNTPGNFVESCIAVLEFQYIFGEQNKLCPPLKRGSGVLPPGKFLNAASLLNSFSSTSLENENYLVVIG